MPVVTKPTLSAAQAERMWRLVQALRVASSEYATRGECATVQYMRRVRAYEDAQRALWSFCAQVESRRAIRR